MSPSLMLVLALSSEALACGGLFCDAPPPETGVQWELPIQQSGEQILFDLSEEGAVTMHVVVNYEGPAADFGWVVPVPGEPQILASSSRIFEDLEEWLGPQRTIEYDESSCFVEEEADTDADTDADSDADTDVDTNNDTDSSVFVLGQQTVGVYDVTTLAASDATDLGLWLEDNGFTVPADMETLIEPYLSNGSNFLAVRLTSDADTGSLAPFAMHMDSATPTIPIRLTSVAASEDMPMVVYMLAPGRGIPVNYLHTQLNPIKVDFWSGGSNEMEVITRGVDESGGHAFVTQHAAPPPGQMSYDMYPALGYPLEALAASETSTEFVLTLTRSDQVPLDDELLALLVEILPPPESAPLPDFYISPRDYSGAYRALDSQFDAVHGAEMIRTRLAQPREAVARVARNGGWATRLVSTLSPSEMTVDPTFAWGDDLEEVPASQVLRIERLCAEGQYAWAAPQRLTYPNGRVVEIPSEDTLRRMGLSAFEYVDRLTDIDARVIEDLFGGEVIARYDDAITEDIERGFLSRGCTQTPTRVAWGAALLGWLAVGFRRKRAD